MRLSLHGLDFIPSTQVHTSCPAPHPLSVQAWDLGPASPEAWDPCGSGRQNISPGSGVQILFSVQLPTHYVTLGSLPPQSGPQFPNYTMRTFNQMISLVPLHATAPRIYDFGQEDLAQTLGNKWHGVYW